MSNRLKITALLFTASLSACGGGGSADLQVTPASGDLGTQPVEQDSSGLAAAAAESGVAATSPFSSLNGQAGRVFVRPDFGVELRVGGTAFEGEALIRSILTNPSDSLSLTSHSFDDGNAVVIINSPSGTSSGPQDSPVTQSLDYAAFGVWIAGETIDLTQGFANIATDDLGAFYAAVPTVLSDMPAQGSAAYSGGVIAAEFNRNEGTSQLLTGQVNMTADFASGSVAGSMSLNDQNGQNVNQINAVNLAISGNTIAGAVTSANGQSGRLEGVFAGPDAAELTGAFSLGNQDSALHGAFGAKR